MSNYVQPRRPSGFNEYLPNEQLAFNRLLSIITKTYETYGFSPLDTPDIELTEVLLAKGGGETEQQVYRFKREGSKTDLTLRYDLTVPLARYVAEHQNDLSFPFRRYHIGKVHRAERAQAGRFREFYQCDIDVIGSSSPVVDAEIPAIINDIFEQFSFGEFVIHINNRRILNGLFEAMGLQAVSKEVLRIIDKADKIREDEMTAELLALGLALDIISKLYAFMKIEGTNQQKLDALHRLSVNNELFREGVAELTQVIESLRSLGVPEARFQIDLKIARGLDYYTGTVYETILTEYPQIGSVCSGGRYDNLTGYYTKQSLPGVGMSIGLTRLFHVLKELGVLDLNRLTPARVMVLPVSIEQSEYAISIAATLRREGIPTILYTEDDSMGKKLKYADKSGVDFAVVVGDNERHAGTVTLKTMATHEDEIVGYDSLVEVLLRHLKSED